MSQLALLIDIANLYSKNESMYCVDHRQVHRLQFHAPLQPCVMNEPPPVSAQLLSDSPLSSPPKWGYWPSRNFRSHDAFTGLCTGYFGSTLRHTHGERVKRFILLNLAIECRELPETPPESHGHRCRGPSRRRKPLMPPRPPACVSERDRDEY